MTTTTGPELLYGHNERPTLNEQRAVQEFQQEWVNRLYERHGAEVAARAVRLIANAYHRSYPQYAGYWDGWTTIAKCTTSLLSKGGLQAEVGDVLLVSPRRGRFLAIGSPDRSFYSVRLGWNCSVSYGVLDIAEASVAA